jgi:hypothetical protein
MAQLQTPAISPVQIFNQRWPNECPKSLGYDLDWAIATEFELNTLIQNSNGQIEGIQSCYYDNSLNGEDVYFESGSTGMRMTFKARWQGFRPLILSTPAQGRFSTLLGVGTTRFLLMNVPIMPQEWDATT